MKMILSLLNLIGNNTEFKESLNSVIYDRLEGSVHIPYEWKSLIVNKRKPYTYRIFTTFGDYRICLHKFDPCFEGEAFEHPHPWPAAFKILKGGYNMKLGRSNNTWDGPSDVSHHIMKAGSCYEITNPLTWHSITPLEETYTIMINGPEWASHIKHNACRTTKGKDLDSLSVAEIEKQLKIFKELIYGTTC